MAMIFFRLQLNRDLQQWEIRNPHILMLNFSKGFLVEQIILATIILYEFGRFFENFSTISFLAGFSHSKKNII